MAKFTGRNDEQLAAGTAIGGTASLLGSTATGAAKYIGLKCGALSALKTGIGWGLALNPVLAAAGALGGIGYLIYKACK